MAYWNVCRLRCAKKWLPAAISEDIMAAGQRDCSAGIQFCAVMAKTAYTFFAQGGSSRTAKYFALVAVCTGAYAFLYLTIGASLFHVVHFLYRV
jgi:hypothetical protein